MLRWEYKMTDQPLSLDLNSTVSSLNSQEWQGWELVGVYYPLHDTVRFVFKRPLKD